MMNIESKSKWQIRLATLSIFLLGFVAGAIALNAYHLWFGGANSNRMSKHERFEEAFNNLDMNETQKAEVQQILGETREKVQKTRQELDPKMQQIRAETDERLQRVLTPEQWSQFQQEREKILQSGKNKSSYKELKLK